jgi:hypothetical protein
MSVEIRKESELASGTDTHSLSVHLLAATTSSTRGSRKRGGSVHSAETLGSCVRRFLAGRIEPCRALLMEGRDIVVLWSFNAGYAVSVSAQELGWPQQGGGSGPDARVRRRRPHRFIDAPGDVDDRSCSETPRIGAWMVRKCYFLCRTTHSVWLGLTDTSLLQSCGMNELITTCIAFHPCAQHVTRSRAANKVNRTSSAIFCDPTMTIEAWLDRWAAFPPPAEDCWAGFSDTNISSFRTCLQS